MRKTILIVDDSVTMLDMLEATLSEAGYGVVRARDGIEAVACARGAKVDCVITDLNMPKMDGFELARTLRAGLLDAGKPILMLTTESSKDKRDQGRRVGATGWICKPFHPPTLIDILARVGV